LEEMCERNKGLADENRKLLQIMPQWARKKLKVLALEGRTEIALTSFTQLVLANGARAEVQEKKEASLHNPSSDFDAVCELRGNYDSRDESALGSSSSSSNMNAVE
jgi:hypothetical protein